MNKKYTINIGDVFNYLTVEKNDLRNKYNQLYLLCKCCCGKEVKCMPHNLVNGKTKSCGCLKIKQLKTNLIKYSVGSKFGKLTIIKDYGIHDKFGKRIFQFQCECGNIKDIPIHYGMKSCGCLKRKSTTPEKDLYTRYRRNAIKHKREFNLTFNEFRKLIYDNCYYCGSIPQSKLRIVNSELHHGIDRVNNDIDYIITNCVTCCPNCNFAKKQLTHNEFMLMIKAIYEKHSLHDLQV